MLKPPHGKICSPIELGEKLEVLKKGRQINFENRKTVIFMILFTPYCVSRTKGYNVKKIFEATKYQDDLDGAAVLGASQSKSWVFFSPSSPNVE